MQIFTRKWSELSGARFDADYHYTNVANSVKTYPLKSICVIKGGKRIPKGKTYATHPTIYKYLRVDDLDSNEMRIDINSLKSIDKEIFDMLKSYEIYNGEIILSNAGTVGKIFLFYNDTENRVILTENCVKLQVTKNIHPKFLNIILRMDFLQQQIKQNYIQTTIPKLAIERIKNLQIPTIPPKEIQQEIIDIVDNAYLCKKQKENEVKNILDSIDLYILDELDIVLPCKNTDLRHRIYTSKLSSISGKRFDCEYHQNYYKDLEKSLSQGKYKLASISSVIRNIKKGIEVGSNKYTKEKAIPFIRVSDISSNGINFDDVDKFITRSLYDNLKADFQPQEGELLYSKDGTIGICLKANCEKEYIISGAIVRIELCGATNSVFFQNLISLNIINILMNREAIGAVIKHLTIDRFLSLEIPLPPLPEQEKIANEIIKRKRKALHLQKEAKNILEYAKIQVEKIILGEEQ